MIAKCNTQRKKKARASDTRTIRPPEVSVWGGRREEDKEDELCSYSA